MCELYIICINICYDFYYVVDFFWIMTIYLEDNVRITNNVKIYVLLFVCLIVVVWNL